MRRVRGGVAAGQVCLAIVLALVACTHGSGWYIGEPDRPSSSGLTVDEDAMVATILDGDVDVEMRLERGATSSNVDGVVSLTLVDLSDAELGSTEIDFRLPAGEMSESPPTQQARRR